jgi:hypothetical protein
MFERPLRAMFHRALRKAFQEAEGRQIAVDALHGLTAWRPALLPGRMRSNPYPDLGSADGSSRSYGGTVFITARFRTGSTLLWNIFRHVDGCVAYYEPLNERRWFDPETRGDRIDATHRGVDDYWREYDGLPDLAQWFRDDWQDRSFLMDPSAWDPNLKRYFDRLIEHAAPRRAVLQCNRIDFRLPWLRRQFPGATFIHLYRHPRDQWCSSLLDPTRVPRDVTMAEFKPFDHFYLSRWALDLQRHFPFLSERFENSPYRIFYFVWKLSYLYGSAYCDHSLAFEDLARSPAATIGRLTALLQLEADETKLAALVTRPPESQWRRYAEPEWFYEHESACERVLTEFFRGQSSVASTDGAASLQHSDRS